MFKKVAIVLVMIFGCLLPVIGESARPATIDMPVDMAAGNGNLCVRGPYWLTGTCNGTYWDFNRHQSGYHCAGCGIGRADDTYAWDVNLYGVRGGDAGQPVYAVEDGMINVSNGWGGSTYGQLLISHTTASGNWSSGYLHMTNITEKKVQCAYYGGEYCRVRKGEKIGEISDVGSPGSYHLHFVVYNDHISSTNRGTSVNVNFSGFSANCAINPRSVQLSKSYATGSITVNSTNNCTWSVLSNVNWIGITSTPWGIGDGIINYSVSEHTTGAGARSGRITVWTGTTAQTVEVTQTDTIFNDVSTSNSYYNYIMAIYNNGITRGCFQNPLAYCPSQNVTRGQMAAFIIRAKYGENFSYTQTPYYSDVPSSHIFFKYVQKLKDEAITVTTGIYDVNGIVDRGQMAAFIIRAKYGESFYFPTTQYFTDVPPNHQYFKYVQRLRFDGTTVVTGTYYVNSYVTRGMMAAFISRAFLGMQ